MRRTNRSGLVSALGLGFALALAGAAYAGDPSRDLDDVDTAESEDSDDLRGESEDSDDLRGESEDEDVVDSEDSDDLEARSGTMREGVSRSLDDAEADVPEWQPPSCDEVEVELGNRPPASDVDGWRGELQNAEAALDKARTKLAAADAEYGYARNRKAPRGEAFKKIVDMRDNARTEFARARCSLPARIEEARRLGVPPEVWRDFPAAME